MGVDFVKIRITTPSNKMTMLKAIKLESADVEIALCNAQGQLLKMYPKETQQAGYYRKEIKINGSIFERYVIRFIIDGQPAGEKIWSE